MQHPVSILFALALASGMTASGASAQFQLQLNDCAGRKPGSVLVFPVHRSGGAWLTILNVSNTSTLPDTPTSFGGSTNAHFEYVNVQPNPTAASNPLAHFMPSGCTIFDRVEFLTPADHISVLTRCHNAFGGTGQEGYVVVSAEDPAQSMGAAWHHNYLIGSEVVLSGSGVTYMLNAYSIRGRCAENVDIIDIGDTGTGTGAPAGPVIQIDLCHHAILAAGTFPYTLLFDGLHYDPLPDALMGDFIGVGGSQLALINFTGGPMIENTLFFEVYNDNELPLSATLRFRCWFDQPLNRVSPLFLEANLENFPNDPQELDITCDGTGDIETGWYKIRSTGTWFSGGQQHSQDGAILGSVVAGHSSVRGAHLLWEHGVQFNGAFRTP
ncbi:MAG: hypothetical protein KDB80_14195 [Planctomycetes bacterium]|nr:hypothetical protein [Planctomycetota bacterium]